MPIYIVKDNHGKVRLINAKTKNGALAFAAKTAYLVERATPKTIVDCMRLDIDVENDTGEAT